MSKIIRTLGGRGRLLLIALAPLYLVPVLFFDGFGVKADAYLKIGDIKGESTDSKHKETIEIQSFSWGMSNPGSLSGGGGGTGKVIAQDIHVSKYIDKSSPILMLHCCTGARSTTADVNFVKFTPEGQRQDYLKVTFSDVIVSSYNFSAGKATDVVPVDSISLNYSKIEMSYIPYDPATGAPGEPVTAVCDFAAPE